jgi:hypothetical protein
MCEEAISGFVMAFDAIIILAANLQIDIIQASVVVVAIVHVCIVSSRCWESAPTVQRVRLYVINRLRLNIPGPLVSNR